MEDTVHIVLGPGGREELFPDMPADWPYLFDRAELDRYPDRSCTWHWHREVELFYVESGSLEYRTRAISERTVFPAGSAGFVNAGYMHMTTAFEPGTVQLLHIFRPELLADPGGRIEKAAIEPLVGERRVDVLAWYPDRPEDRQFLDLIASSFSLGGTTAEGAPAVACAAGLAEADAEPQVQADAGKTSYGVAELRLRSVLSQLWCHVFQRARPLFGDSSVRRLTQRDIRFQQMVEFVHEHFAEPIGVADIAAAAATSERDCYRIFEACAGKSPHRYLRDYRIEQSCRLLAFTTRPLSAVARSCGFATASRFGAVFRELLGSPPSAYRARWRELDS